MGGDLAMSAISRTPTTADVEKLEQRIDDLERECDEMRQQLMWYEYDTDVDEARRLRDFIADVRLGIRDLDEYEAVCGG